MDGQAAESVREMRAVLEDGKKVFSRSAQIELTLGVAYYSMRRFPDAVDAFLRVIGIDPGVEQPYVFLGRMLDQTEAKLPDVTAAFAARQGESGELHGRFPVWKSSGVRREAGRS
jgi:hypothetical protein